MFSNPKRIRKNGTQKDSWFDYYAGFSAAFVHTVLDQVLPGLEGRVLDPWNGSGTTTTTAHELGICSMGIDVNPVMAVVAKAKLLGPGVQESLLPLARDIIARSHTAASDINPVDPLLEWFSRSAARGIRSLEQAIRKILTDLEPAEQLVTSAAIDAVSDLAAFYLVALFRTTRSFLRRFQASNPTWIKSPKTAQERVRPNTALIEEAFLRYVDEMSRGVVPAASDATTTISLASSECLPLPAASIDAVISSPPYCTRIDYAVATKPELSVLGCPSTDGFDILRRRMLGGPVVLPEQPTPVESWGPSCRELLNQVKSHATKGSATYYYKTFTQYYGSLHQSLSELDRTLVNGGHCVLVVQDSHYKEVHVDVARHITEMAQYMRWSIEQRIDFETRVVMARVNPRAQKYRSHSGATESVLWFTKAL